MTCQVSHEGAGAQGLGSSAAAFPRPLAGSSIQVAGTVGGGLTYNTMVPASPSLILNITTDFKIIVIKTKFQTNHFG